MLTTKSVNKLPHKISSIFCRKNFFLLLFLPYQVNSLFRAPMRKSNTITRFLLSPSFVVPSNWTEFSTCDQSYKRSMTLGLYWLEICLYYDSWICFAQNLKLIFPVYKMCLEYVSITHNLYGICFFKHHELR